MGARAHRAGDEALQGSEEVDGQPPLRAAKETSLLLSFWDPSPASPTRPLRFLEAPGPALLRQNLSWLRRETNPLPTHLLRIAEAKPKAVYVLFDIAGLAAALGACRRLSERGVKLTAVRGRLVPAGSVGAFAGIFFGEGFARLLAAENPLPARWAHPVVLAEAFHPRIANLRYGAVFSRLPEPGVLDIEDFGRAGVREGAPPSALEGTGGPEDLKDLVTAAGQAGASRMILVDNGGSPAELAERLLLMKKLGAWLGPARGEIPESVRSAGVPIYTWFEPEDLSSESLGRRPPVSGGCAFVPVGLPGDDIPGATVRLLAIRSLGYDAVLPRFFLPVPNTREWADLEREAPLRSGDLSHLHPSRLAFGISGFGSLEGPELLEIWRRENRWPVPLEPDEAGRQRRYSLESVRDVLDGYLADAAGGANLHARDTLRLLLDTLGESEAALTSLPRYPFLAWRGESLLGLVQTAIEGRLRALDNVPEPLLSAVQHAALAGGKRIRPILLLAITCSRGVEIEAALPAALATEWIHSASLIQDDLPCMDDDAIRRKDVSTHVREGEAMAILAADTLIAMAFQDVAGLAGRPSVGPERTAAMLKEIAQVIGQNGLVGGQARDLIARRGSRIGIHEVLDIHRHKTMPLFRLTASLAVLLAGIPEEPLGSRLVEMLGSLGLAFQIVDDSLDATPDNEDFGRPAGSDARNRLPTFASLLGAPRARRYAGRLMAPYLTIDRGQPGLSGLTRLARYVLERRQ